MINEQIKNQLPINPFVFTRGKIIGLCTFFLTLGLGFTRDENVIVFYISFGLFSVVTILLYLQSIKRVEIPFLIKGYLLFTIFAGCSVFWALDQELAVNMFVRLLVIVLLMYLMFLTDNRYGLITYFSKGLITLIVLNFVFWLLPLNLSMNLDGSIRYSGTFDNANELAIVTLFGIFFYSKLRQLGIFQNSTKFFLFLLISSILIFSTGSRKGLVLGGLLIIISIFSSIPKEKRRSILAIGLLSIPILFLIVITSIDFFIEQESIKRLLLFIEYANGGEGDSSTKWRFYFIEEAIKIFKDNFYKGIGIDNFQSLFGEGLYSHNNYVEILANLGIIGFSLLYALYFWFLFFLRKHNGSLIDYTFFFTILILDFFMVSYFMRPFWISMIFFYATVKSHSTTSSS